MRKFTSLFIFLVYCGTLPAQEKMYIHQSDHYTLGALISKTDSVYFKSDRSRVFFKVGEYLADYPVNEIDSISFGPNSENITITYNGNSVTVFNPLAFEGVSVSVNGTHVTVNAPLLEKEVTYYLKGNTSDGMFKIYSGYRFNLVMDGVNITNTDGPAINIQSEKKCSISLAGGTTNSLNDGSTYATSAEDQKATLFSEGQLSFTGTGSLTVKSISNHAICSDDYVLILDGNITVSGAGKDGVHANDFFTMSGGKLNVTATGDGIDCEGGNILVDGGSITTLNTAADVNGIKSDSTLTISGGTLQLTVNGTQSKGLKSVRKMTLSGGNITVNTSGGVFLQTSGSGYNPAYCTAIKSDEDVEINGSTITLNSTGMGNKSISATKNITCISGTINITNSGSGTTYKNSSGVTDSYNATCLTADGNISILGGILKTSSSGSGGRAVNADGTLTIGDTGNSPNITITTTGAKFLISGSGSNAEYCEAKAIKTDGAITINNGTVIISSADDGIKSKTSVTINGGDITVNNSYEGIESPFITINNGNVHVQATNDGINTSKGTVNGGTETNDGSILTINGGYVVSGASSGDAADCNGNAVMTGGTFILHGPPSQPEEAIDFNGTFNISGGFFIAAGTNSNMNKPMSSTSTQFGFYALTTSVVSSASLFRVQDSSGKDLVTFKPARNAYSFLFSSPDLKSGTTFSIYTGGTCTGTQKDGLYSGGTYSAGTLKKSFTLSNKVTSMTF
jgi:trimeric autotransporter adhesin